MSRFDPSTPSGDEIERDKIIAGDEVHGDSVETKYQADTIIINPHPSDELQDEAPAAGDSPYQGLHYFDVGDADRFFGRETLTTELVNTLADQRFLAVIGASGSGKSSLVRAGMTPLLAKGEAISGSDRWLLRIVTPTARPLQALAARLTADAESVRAQITLEDDLRREPRSLDRYISRLVTEASAERLLLVVDQFEELFTLCRDQNERIVFVNNLLAAAQPDGMTTLILTLRADFYHHCADFDRLRGALEQHQRYIGAMTPDDLRSAIERPAEAGKWEFEPGLVDLMLEDGADEPGALPLLSYALLETWQRRRGRTLTFEGYHAAGGVKGAIARRADAEFNKLNADQQLAARNIFIRLTELGEGSEDTRRRVPRSELAGAGKDSETVEQVLTTLGYARLITADRDEVEVAHEALIREWPTLRNWLDENRDGLTIHRRLTEAAGEWQQMDGDSSVLYRGTRLAQALDWRTENAEQLNDLERDFLDQSHQAEAAEARERAEREAQSRFRLRAALAAVALALAVSLTAAILILNRNQTLNDRNDELTAAKATAEANAELAAQQVEQLEGERLLSEAYRVMEDDLDADAAIALWRDATAVQPELLQRVGVSTFPTDTRRYVATQWIYQGEALLREARTQASDAVTRTAWISATALFQRALALEPPADTPLYVPIPAGTFIRGSDDGANDERPVREIYLAGYWILRTEVTNRLYARCVDAGVCEPPGNIFWTHPQNAEDPVTHVDWHQAAAYAGWVGGRLPTEAEWERACRAGDTGQSYAWGATDPSPDLLNFDINVGGVTSVGSYPAGANGLFDMAGNVWEWTADWYNDEYYAVAPEENPQGPDEGDFRALRGGAWNFSVDGVRCADRCRDDPLGRYCYVGFRVVDSSSPGS